MTQDEFVGGTTEINWTSNSKHATGYRVEWTRQDFNFNGDSGSISDIQYPTESKSVGRNARGLVLHDLVEDADYDVQGFRDRRQI